MTAARGALGRSRRGLGAAVMACALVLGCATHPPITKLVNGRLITTRSINPSAYEHVSRALLYEEDERWNDAAAELQRALVDDGDSPELHAHLAEIFMHLDRQEDAVAAIKASLAIEITADGLTAEAHLKQLRGDLAGAVASLERAAALVRFDEDESQAEGAYLELAEASLLALDAPRARRALETLCRAAPSSLSGRLQLSAVTWAMGDVRETERRLKEALAEEPNQLEALLSLATLAASLGQSKEARAHFADALDRSEGAPEVAAAYVKYLLAVDAKKEAEQLIDDLPAFEPNDNEAIARRLELERMVKRYDRALAIIAKAEQSDPSEDLAARLPLLRAQVLAEQGKRDEAIALLLAIGKETRGHLEARLQAAELMRENGKAAEAARILAEEQPSQPAAAKKAAAQSDDDDDEVDNAQADIELAVARAQVEERRGDPARGSTILHEALARHPKTSRLLLTEAALEDRRGQWKRALELAEQVLAKEPGSVEALNFWGFVAADHDHQLPRALLRLTTALALSPGTAAIIDSVGWAHLRTKDLARASLFLEQAHRLDPTDPEVLSHVGRLYVERADPVRAAAVFRKALSLSPEDALRRRLEDELARIESRKAARP